MEKDFSVLDDFTWQELVTEVYRRGIGSESVIKQVNTLKENGDLTYAERAEQDGETDEEV